MSLHGGVARTFPFLPGYYNIKTDYGNFPHRIILGLVLEYFFLFDLLMRHACAMLVLVISTS